MTTVCDALGNPIEIGEKYGYSTTSSGWARTVVGKALKANEATGKVSISVERVQHYLYGAKTSGHTVDADKVSVRSLMLFPVRDTSATQ